MVLKHIALQLFRVYNALRFKFTGISGFVLFLSHICVVKMFQLLIVLYKTALNPKQFVLIADKPKQKDIHLFRGNL
jgi:hypothetical protein